MVLVEDPEPGVCIEGLEALVVDPLLPIVGHVAGLHVPGGHVVQGLVADVPPVVGGLPVGDTPPPVEEIVGDDKLDDGAVWPVCCLEVDVMINPILKRMSTRVMCNPNVFAFIWDYLFFSFIVWFSL